MDSDIHTLVILYFLLTDEMIRVEPSPKSFKENTVFKRTISAEP